MLGCIQPMSSPMMKRMFGFWVALACANELVLDPTSNIDANRQVVASVVTLLRYIPISCHRWRESAVSAEAKPEGARAVPRRITGFHRTARDGGVLPLQIVSVSHRS